ncbi:28S ribosomal protein S10, mitochondrial [Polistes fuscatus]|uniref:28S ribosomal protein S10, mitochondrial n=1 Tax=Polistes fuscatus TaxID=30207 RepID=UPI001CA948E8|nr:28S ribosomal protein S10, mitochondrial [Polistes fuscatus]XP_043492510.1 28S ribosomal protein S10, mitochondrial [Polistes fuscatus]XP_043492511.1 28S ribosomal protein S10, mitochondrial [Polistes fuscatus]
MLHLKVGSMLRIIISDTIRRETGHIGILTKPFSALVEVKNEDVKPNPDKLYKKIEIEVRGNDSAVLKSYGQFTEMTANHLGINMLRNTTPRKPIFERLTVLKSVHVHKKHRVQYETRTYYRFMDFAKLTGSTADTFLEYLQRNLPEGVAMKVTKVELQKLPESIQTPPTAS